MSRASHKINSISIFIGFNLLRLRDNSYLLKNEIIGYVDQNLPYIVMMILLILFTVSVVNGLYNSMSKNAFHFIVESICFTKFHLK